LGGVYFGRVIDKGKNPLLVYALLEAGIGVFAFLMPFLFSGLSEIYVSISRHFAVGFYGISLIRFALSFLVLLVPATLMGGTLPVIIKFFANRQERLGWHVGQLYSINTFGAVVGTLSAGFFFILILGVKETAYAAGVVNLLIAGVVFALDRRLGVRRVADSTPKDVGYRSVRVLCPGSGGVLDEGSCLLLGQFHSCLHYNPDGIPVGYSHRQLPHS
jgi:hypothetical protein